MLSICVSIQKAAAFTKWIDSGLWGAGAGTLGVGIAKMAGEARMAGVARMARGAGRAGRAGMARGAGRAGIAREAGGTKGAGGAMTVGVSR